MCHRSTTLTFKFANLISQPLPGMKSREAGVISEFRSITATSEKDASRFVKKYKTLEAALDAFYNDLFVGEGMDDKAERKESGMDERMER
ncbi:hypothetical protein I302_100837 [Kwoniella bestiolae CBS 10118]|uniref:Uncharacterized protein n=1 Tax=Kwoniella bestiolae CBS 10118 TaxID=1296100 RepID=A0AAJ8K0K2_9TREE